VSHLEEKANRQTQRDLANVSGSYSNANYALSETKNPVRTLKFAAPLALGSVGVLYMLVNVSHGPVLPHPKATEERI